jgi:hypothetical protein
MENVITNILTSTSVRSDAAVEEALIQEVGVASPWAD